MKDRKYISTLCSILTVWFFGLLGPASAATIHGTVTDSNGPVGVPDPLELTGTIDITSPGSLINGVNFQLELASTISGIIRKADGEMLTADALTF